MNAAASCRDADFSREQTSPSQLDHLPRPPWLRNASLRDNKWIVETDDPLGRRDTKQTISFAVPIAPGPTYLTDPAHAHDLETLKIFLYESISGDEPWVTSASTMVMAATHLLAFMRWRVAQRIPDMRSLNRDWYNHYVDTLRQHGPAGLTDVKDRIRLYVQELQTDRRQLPIVTHGGKKRVALDTVARHLGFPRANALPDGVLDPLIRHIEKHFSFLPHDFSKSRHFREDSGARSKNHLGGLLRPWDLLWRLRHKMPHDPIGYRAFDFTSTSNSQALAIQRISHQPVPLAPAYQACYLINASLAYLRLSPELLFLQAAVKRIYSQKQGEQRRRAIQEVIGSTKLGESLGKAGLGRGGALHPTYILPNTLQREHGSVALYNLLYDFLPAACAIIIAAFTARRTGELESLKHGCTFSDSHGRRYMSCWIEKSLRAIDNVPIPGTVERAIMVLEELSASRRAATGEPWITLFRGPSSSTDAVNRQFGPRLQRFVDFVDVPPLPSGTKWTFEMRQFRTFFSTIYYHRFHYPSLTALSDFLKHFNPDTTKAYITAAVQGGYLHMSEERNRVHKQRALDQQRRDSKARLRDFEDGRISFIVETAKGAIAKKEHMSGPAGDTWKRELGELVQIAERHIVLTSASGTDTFDGMLREWARTKHLDPHPQGHSFCTYGDKSLSTGGAICVGEARARGVAQDRDPKGRVLAFASDLNCSICPHNLQTPITERYWLAKEREAREAAAKCLTPRQRVAAAKRAELCGEHLRRCFGRVEVS